MTACFAALNSRMSEDGYIDSAPIVVADTMQTEYPSYLPIITPASRIKNSEDYSCVELVRKLYVFNKNLAVAVCGDNSEYIVKFLRSIESEISNCSDPNYTFDRMFELLEYFPGTGFVASYIMPDEIIQKGTGIDYNSKALGLCSIIGSGSNSVVDRLSDIDKHHDRNFSVDVGEQALSIPSGLNAALVAKELTGGLDDWGVYFESVRWSPNGWRRGGRELHLFYELIRKPNSVGSVNRIPKMLAYDGSGVHGRIYSAGVHPDGPLFRSYTIRNLLASPLEADIPHNIDFWFDWIPDSVSLTMLFAAEDGSLSTITQICGMKEYADKILFHISAGNCQAKTTYEEFHRYSEEVVTSMGLRYDPHTPENDPKRRIGR